MGEGPKYTFPKEKNNHSDPEDVSISKKTLKYPGPTTYYKNQFSYTPSGPFISMSKLKRPEVGSDKFLLSTPGPNKYNPDKQYLSTWTVFPAWNWHMQEKKSKSNSSKKDKVTPGPGEYKINNEIGLGPKYSIRKKLKKAKKIIFLVLVVII